MFARFLHIKCPFSCKILHNFLLLDIPLKYFTSLYKGDVDISVFFVYSNEHIVKMLELFVIKNFSDQHGRFCS